MRALQDVVQKDVDAVVAALKARGITKFASVGWCWGASMAVQAAAADAGSFRATAFLHPSMFRREKELVGQLQCPLASFSTPGGKGLLSGGWGGVAKELQQPVSQRRCSNNCLSIGLSATPCADCLTVPIPGAAAVATKVASVQYEVTAKSQLTTGV